MTPLAIIVHGGAKTIPAEEHAAHREGCRAAAERGWRVLAEGGSAVDAVEAAIRHLEDDPTFNAGFGSELNEDGDAQMDAGLMEGREFAVGAVAGVLGVRHPIGVARAILDSEHALLVGDGARRFARESGCEICEPSEMVSEARRKAWEEAQAESEPRKVNNTVGCVARDGQGTIAAGASTGGTGSNPPGRVGDTPLAGAGFYADDEQGGCAMTGDGECILRVVLAKRITDGLVQSSEPDRVVREAIDEMARRVGGEAGGIVLDRDGRPGWEHNSEHMAIGLRTAEMPEARAYVSKAEESHAG